MKMLFAKTGTGVMVMGALCLLLLPPIWWQSTRHHDLDRPIADFAGKPMVGTYDLNTKLPRRGINDYEAILSRPLFSPTRRRPPEPVSEPVHKAAESAVTPLPRVQLQGVIITPDQKVAVLMDMTNLDTIYVHQGDTLSGWRVSKVTKEKIVLSHGTTKHELPLRDYGGADTSKATQTQPAIPNDLRSILSATRQGGSR